LADLLLLDRKIVLEEGKLGSYPEVAFAESDMVANGEHAVWRDVVGLESVRLQNLPEEVRRWKRKSALHQSLRQHHLVIPWSRSWFIWN
jgi:hypothetical protein